MRRPASKKTLLINLFSHGLRVPFLPVKFPLLSLFSHLRNEGLEVDVLDLEAELGRPRTERELEEFFASAEELVGARDFDVAAVSCYGTKEYASVMRFGRIVRRIRPGALIATGGYHPTALPGDFTGPSSAFDFVITGEGESALADVASGRVCRPADGPAVLAGRPLPLTDDTVYRFEAYPYAHLPAPIASLVLSRGCPFDCAYCIEPAIGAGYRVFSVRKSLELLDEVIAVSKPKILSIHDPIFGFPKTWRREFLGELARRRLPVQLGVELRIDMLDREDIELLSRLDITVHVGVETASPRMMRIMRKSTNPELYLSKIGEHLSCAADLDALFAVNILFNHPGETPEGYRETLDYFQALQAGLPRTTFSLHPMQYQFLPGSPEFYRIADYERDYGTKILDKNWWKTTRLGDDSGSVDVVASRELEQEFGPDPFYWKAEFQGLNERILAKASLKHKMAVYLWARYCEEASQALPGRRSRPAGPARSLAASRND